MAVVAVHGVADHPPCSTAHAVADLLHRGTAADRYTTFTERELRIGLAPMTPDAPARDVPASVTDRLRRRFRIDERSAFVREAHPATGDLGDEFMREQLLRYRSGGGSYGTIRVSGMRKASTEPAVEVDVHEVYWADLSREMTGGLRLFGELFQILFHLPSLGRHAIEYARLEHTGSRLWSVYALLQRLAVRLLVLGAPVLGLALLSVLISLGALAAQGAARGATAALIFGAGAMVAGTALAYRAGGVGPMRVWLGPLAGGAVAGIVYAVLRATHWEASLVPAVIAALLLSSVLVIVALWLFDSRRPGAFVTGVAVQAMVVVCVWAAAVGTSDEAGLATEVLRAAAWLWRVLAIVSGVFVGVLLAAAGAGVIAVMAVSDPAERRRARGASWTGAFSLALPAALVGMLIVLVWSIVAAGLVRALPERITTEAYATGRGSFLGVIDPDVLEAARKVDASERPSIETVAGGLNMMLVGPSFLFPPGAVLILLLTLPVAVIPAVVADRRLRPGRAPDEAAASRLGGWLDGGYWLAAFAGSLVSVAYLAIPVIGRLRPAWLDRPAARLSEAGAALLVGLLTARNWLPGLRAATGILLDVDGYLREHPRDATPRARIAERFVSLLRNLHESGDGEPRYDALVIVAHSQGTVIAADLLRFLVQHPDSKLDPWPWPSSTHLLTFGSPLRQLYAACFPHLYRWVGDGNAPPDPAALRLTSWTNFYRSGDFIGRYLWNTKNPWSLTPVTLPRRRERCLGAGAHTRYWDDAGWDVAQELDDIIRKA